MKIAVSILKSSYDEEETIKKINETDAEYIHLDVMDGLFVLEKTPKREYLHKSRKKLQVHLMVNRPFSYISEYLLNNTDSIIIHGELDDDITSLLTYIKSLGIRCGLALKPKTDVKKILPYIDMLDDVLVLTVEPGKGGQKLMDSVVYKIDLLKDIRKDKKLNYLITVDGGVNDETINKVKNADIVVSGSYICTSDNFQEKIDKLRQ